MSQNTSRSDPQDEESLDMIAVYRHDVHKLTGEPHQNASQTYAGIPVNQPVPHGADGDASMLSRPPGKPQQTVENHTTAYRLSLLTGDSQNDLQTFTRRTIENAVRDLLTNSDPETMHHAWLKSDVVAAFNESIYYPYTSLKYHTLLVAALLNNYHQGREFTDLHLVVDPAGEIIPHRTVYSGDRFALRIDANPDDQPHARLGNHPRRSWASTWNRLTAHPLNTDHDKYDMVLDANLRRIRAWSTALQYIEDFEHWHDRPNKTTHCEEFAR